MAVTPSDVRNAQLHKTEIARLETQIDTYLILSGGVYPLQFLLPNGTNDFIVSELVRIYTAAGWGVSVGGERHMGGKRFLDFR